VNKGIKALVYTSMLAALIAVATLFIQIPIPMDKGYCNLGDGLILAAGALLGPWTAAAAAAGSALADLVLGYALYAPATAVIKGLMGMMAGVLCNKSKVLWRRVLIMAAAECLMVGGYFLFETALYGAAAAATSLFGNGCQAIAGLAVGTVLWPMMERVRKMTACL